METTIKLTQPIKVHDEEMHELTLREPTSKDSEELGYPYELVPLGGSKGEMALRVRPDIILQYGARLANIPPPAIKQLRLSDLMTLTSIIMGFFGQSE